MTGGDIPATADLLFFFDGKPMEHALYRQTEAAVLQRLPDTRIQVKKTQISFLNRHLYACISWPRQKNRPPYSLMLTFGLARRVLSPRIAQSVEPYPNRWTHHLLLTEAEQLDDELLGWLEEAYHFAYGKR